jgi:hypothetical protein
VVEFDHFKIDPGLPSFVLSSGKLCEETNIKDIAFELLKRIEKFKE